MSVGDCCILHTGHVERGVELVLQSLVVGEERERISVLLRGRNVYQIERLALLIIEFLEYPRLHLRAAIGEGDPVEIVAITVSVSEAACLVPTATGAEARAQLRPDLYRSGWNCSLLLLCLLLHRLGLLGPSLL